MTSLLLKKFLTRSLPGHDIFVLWNQPKNRSFLLPYQTNSFSADCTRELFKPSKDLANVRVCNEKKFLVLFFLWVTLWGRFLAILAHVTWPRAQPLDGDISLKFSFKTRLESFEPLIDFLAFLVPKLWSKINKLIN